MESPFNLAERREEEKKNTYAAGKHAERGERGREVGEEGG